MSPEKVALQKLIADVVRSIEITDTEAWNDLDALSNRTAIEAIEVFEDEIKVRGEAFEGLVNIHCTLSYGSGEDAFTLSETFPGRFDGQLEQGNPRVNSLTVDTSGFRA